MSQVGWLVDGQKMTHQELLDYAKDYPATFPYTPEMLDGMFNHKERNHISPTMLSGCPRQEVLKRHVSYYDYPDHAWTRYRGTIAHKILEGSKNEPGAIIEQLMELELQWDDGTLAYFAGTPDKVLPDQKLLIDYKTVKDVVQASKKSSKGKIDGWRRQVSTYRWMLYLHDTEIVRAIIEQISMSTPARLEVGLWSLEESELYVMNRSRKFVGVFNGEYSLDNLPPMLDPDLDAELIWLCMDHRGGAWCPVRGECFALHERGK